jgi:hypothetical protein
MEAMQAVADNRSPGAKDAAKKLLQEMLAGDTLVPVTEIEEAAEANGISKATLRRAKDELGVIAEKNKSKDGKWHWKMPKLGWQKKEDNHE